MTASTLYLDHFQLNRAPFDQEPDTRIFFPIAGRTTVLKNLLADIEAGRPLVKLTGSEGTGKTFMCRLLEQALDPAKYQLVSLEHPIGSYKNLLRTVCLILELADEQSDEEKKIALDYVALFREHLHRLNNEGRNLVMLVDEAENLFLATLERLVRLICDTVISDNLQILLIGRLDLDTNLDQLAIYCSNVDINAGYTLEALSSEETKQYIQFRLQGADIPGNKYLDIFSDDAIDMIFQAAMGNISLTNSLAEQGLKKACAQGMFQVDDELFQPQQGIEENVSFAFFQGFDFLKDNKWWLLAGILLVWFALVLVWPDHEQPETEAFNEGKLEVIVPEEEIVVPPDPDAPGIEGSLPVVTDADKLDVEKRVQQVTSGAEGKLQKTEPAKQKMVLKPDKKKKIVMIEPVPKNKEERLPARDGTALFNERLRASSAWLAWAYRGEYTIQLMVLVSEKAEENLKKILIDDKYYQIKDKLYILRKISPKTLYVYYGNYSGMDEAREARNKMPPFLKDNQPYALSIQDAMKKIEE